MHFLNSLRFGFLFLVFIYACLHRDTSKLMPEHLDTILATGSAAASAVCPWDEDISTGEIATVSVSVCPWDDEEPPSTSKQAVAR